MCTLNVTSSKVTGRAVIPWQGLVAAPGPVAVKEAPGQPCSQHQAGQAHRSQV